MCNLAGKPPHLPTLDAVVSDLASTKSAIASFWPAQCTRARAYLWAKQKLTACLPETDVGTKLRPAQVTVNTPPHILLPSMTAHKAQRPPVSGHDTKRHRIPKNHCFGCGPDNSDGMRLKFVLDEDNQQFVCKFNLSRRYVGPPAHAHGGIIATVLDEAMGKANKLKHVIALTKEMTVEYIRPVPLGKKLTAIGRNDSVHGRAHINVAEIRNEEGQLLARSRGTFIAIDPEKMFGKHVKGKQAKPQRP